MAPPAFVLAPFSTKSRNVLPPTTSSRPTYRVSRPCMGLSVKTEAMPKSQVGLEISVGKEECAQAWNSVIKDLQKRAKVDGFRAGKVPKQVIVSQFGEERIRASACEEVIEKSIQKALSDAGINAIGQAQFNSEGGVEEVIQNYSPKSDLTFKVKIDVWPQTNFIEPYDQLSIEAEDVVLDETLIDAALEELRKKESFSVLSPEGTTADIGKVVVIDMLGFYEKESGSKGDRLPEIADGTNIEIVLENGKFFEGFVEGLLGAAVGEMRSIPVKFPAQNARLELAGKNAIFDVTVKAIKDVVLPELNDEFAKQVSECDSLDGLRKQVRERLGTETQVARDKNVDKAIEDRLAEIVEVEIPETLLENQIKKNFATMLAGFKDTGMSDNQIKAMVTKENYDLYKQRGVGRAERSLKVNFAVSKIANELKLELPQEDLDFRMDVARRELKGQEVEEEKLKDQVESQLERDIVLYKLKEKASITMLPPKTESESAEAKEVATAA